MTVTDKRIRELNDIRCIRDYGEALQDQVLKGELSLTKTTIHEYQNEAERVLRQIGSYDGIPSKEQCIEWKEWAEEHYSKLSLAKKIVSLNHFLSLNGCYYKLPLPKHIKRETEPQPLTEAQVFQMVDYLEDKHKYTKSLMVFIGYTCAVRATALINIQVKDCDFDKNTIFLRKTKRDKPRRVPLSSTAMEKVRRYVEELRPEPIYEQDDPYLFIEERKLVRATYGYFFSSIKAVAHKLQFKTSVYPHILRHSRVLELRKRHYSWEKILTLGGWSDLRSLSSYIHGESVGALQQSLEADEGEKTPQSENERLQRENELLRTLLSQQNPTPKVLKLGIGNSDYGIY